ncbi:MAG TPA: cytochrome C [Burkholderiales bacterium]|nr:cytochrome C [Burkholderiales bacterium]
METRKAKFIVPVASLVVAFGLGFPGQSHAVPSFARQTGMACQACHTVFPELTPFGRSFKLNGYQIDNLPQVQGITSSKEYELLLNQVPPLSMMFQTSYTKTKQALPDSAVPGANAQDGQVLFPQQASLFYAGRIASGLGAFVQITYDSASGNVHWDNSEIRYAKQLALGASPLTLGITMNNNPTVQDVWNSTPAWQTPFDQKTSAAPVPGAITQIDGLLTGRGVAGLTGYLWWKNSIYAEFGMYRSSPQGFNVNGLSGPLDSTAGGTLTSNAPYWRLAYEHQWNRNSLSVGMYGMEAKLSPPGQPVAPPTNRFRDTALDGQYQYIGDEHVFSAQTTYIKERQHLDGFFALGESENATNDLKTFRLGGSYYYRRTYGAALGRFSTTGSSDALLYPASPTFGFGNNSPNSNGWVGELSYIPWQNVKLLVQYVAYQKFNGASSNYDGNGRNARDNNTLYLLGWLSF